MKKTLCFLITVLLALPLFGCSGQSADDSNNDGITIIATLFPQYDFARQIAGDKGNVELLLDPGVETHSYDPTPADKIKINNADVFIYTGEYMETWAETLIADLNNTTLKVVDVSSGITLEKVAEHEHEDEEEVHSDEATETHIHEYDPHIWTDPQNAKIMVNTILEALCEIDEDNTEYYKSNAKKYIDELDRLDNEIQEVVDSSKHNTIYFGGRFALTYFAKRYNISCEAAYDSCSTETEPSAKSVAEIIDEMKADDIKVIFYEELVDPKVAYTIADETGAKPLLLHSCHNVSKEDFDNGVTYVSLMEQNIINLREGLN